MLTLKRASALRRELTAARHIPYRAHVSEHVVRTGCGDYLQVFRLGGASFESADDDLLNTLSERLNILWRNIASPNVALWAQVIRRRERCSLPDVREEGFAADSRLKVSRAAGCARRSWSTSCIWRCSIVPLLLSPRAWSPELLSRAQPDASRLELPMHSMLARNSARHCWRRSPTTSPSVSVSIETGIRWCSAVLEYFGAAW